MTVYFSNSDEQQQQRREIFELLARQDVDELRALNLGKLADLAGIGNSVVGIITNLFRG
jgi:hypothetical protein